MFSLSPRVTEAIKPALAIAIIYMISFYMGWDKPYWAAVSAASVNLLSYGMTLHRGIIRVLATLGGGCVGMIIIGLFPQERWMYMIAGSIPLFIWGYGCAGEKEDYLWVVGGITFMVVMAVVMTVEHGDSGTVFDIVALRVTQTLMGSGVMMLISVYLWPKNSIGQFEGTVRKGLKNQRRLLDLYRRNALLGEDTNEKAKRLRLEDARLQEIAHFELHISENDSFEMLETRHDWHHFMHFTAAQVECLESLRESRAEVKELEMKALLPNLEAFCAEIDQRLVQIDRMLTRQSPLYTPNTVELSLNQAELQALSRFQQAAVGLTKTELEKLDEVSRSLFDTVAEIRMFERPDKEHHGHHGGHDEHHEEGSGFHINLDQLAYGLGAVVGVWIAFFTWIFVYDIPNGPIFWAMAGIFTMIIAYRAEMPLWDIYWSWAVGGGAAVICYTYVMQHLSGYLELGTMFFVVCFVLGYILYPRPHPGARMFAVISFTIVLSADNHQHYSLPHTLHYMIWLFLVLSIAVIGRNIFVPNRPEKVVLRLHDRFFRHADWLISCHAPGAQPQRGLVARWKQAIYGDDLAALPGRMALYANQTDYNMLPGITPRQIDELLVSVYALAYRVKGLVAASKIPQADLIEKQLRAEKQDWHQDIEAWFRRQADATQPVGPPPPDLPARLTRLEHRINETLEGAGEGALEPRDYENFHRLLGSYRSLSEAATNYAQVSAKIDWSLLREMRFPIAAQRGIWPEWRQRRRRAG